MLIMFFSAVMSRKGSDWEKLSNFKPFALKLDHDDSDGDTTMQVGGPDLDSTKCKEIAASFSATDVLP